MSGPHGHGPGRARATQRRLVLALALSTAYMLAEVIGGFLANSLALLADAGHMLTDAAALALAIMAIRLARRPATAAMTYGYHRAEILAALANGATVVAIAIVIAIEAVRRLGTPPEVRSGLMLTVALGGLLVNLAMLGILHRGRRESLNLRGAWLHVLTDALGSMQAIVAALLIRLLGWRWADPVASLLIALLIAYSAYNLLRRTIAVLMEGVPPHIDVDEVRTALLALPGVAGVHDLHIWTITSGFEAVSAHLLVGEEAREEALLRAREVLRERFGIEHSTIQVEIPAKPELIT
jgi:cobalt-zinc-cadmium efflux system protein